MNLSPSTVLLMCFSGLISTSGCSQSNTTTHGELPDDAVIEVTFDQLGTNTLAYHVSATNIVLEGGDTSHTWSTSYGRAQVEPGETWTYKREEDEAGNGLDACFSSPGGSAYTIRLKSGDKVVKEVKCGDAEPSELLAGVLVNDRTNDVDDLRLDSEQKEFVTQLLSTWLEGGNLQAYWHDAEDTAPMLQLQNASAAIREQLSPNVTEAVNRFGTWVTETAEGDEIGIWGVLVREGEKELIIELGRNESGKLVTFLVTGALLDGLSLTE